VTASNRYRVDPDDPRAPPLEIWRQLSPEERARIIAELPSEVDLGPPEGDAHRVPKQRALEALEAFFKRAGRNVYLSSELPVYYPGERMFAPDLIAVLDEPHERASWVVAQEGRGLDFALEVTLSGSRRKDLEDNVARFAALGIPEYFVFDRPKRRILGYRLPPAAGAYEPIVPQQGRWRSAVLGLELGVEESRFRFYVGSAVVPEASELVERANQLSDRLQDKMAELERELQLAAERAEQADGRAKQAEERAGQAEERAEFEQRQRGVAERRLKELEAELERLRRGRDT
jgi:Uma2 family endonuclease